MAELTRKKRVRAGHKASATRLMSSVDDLVEAEEGPDTAKLSRVGMSLKEKLKDIKTLDSEVLELVRDEDLEAEITQADEFRERIYAVLIRVEEACAPAPTSRTPPATGTTASGSTSKVRLPKLTIKNFSGKLTAWTPFWDSFSSAIHSNSDLSPIDKFNYLRSMVSGAALEAISGLTLTGPNYEEAVQILQKRFGNKQLIINKHMEQLLNVDGVNSQHDVKGLRHLYNAIESNVRSLKSLGVAAESYGSLLVSVLMTKLPPEIRLIASRKFKDEESWKFDDMLELIEEEVQARERSSSRTPQSERRPKELPTGATLLTEAKQAQCCFCQQGHASQGCRTVASIDSRREALKRAGRCFICLRRGHLSRTCQSRIRCLNCRGRHHVAICSVATNSQPKSHDSEAQEPKQGSSTPSDTSSLNPEATPYTPTLWTYVGRQVLLQTAQTTAFNLECPSRSMSVRVVMDTGSQLSYITEAARNRLALPTTGRRIMSIMTFGATGGSNQNCEYVNVGIKLRNGQSHTVTLFCVRTICEPLLPLPLADCKSVRSHLSDLEFADPVEDNQLLPVDILIGSDHYWDFVTGRLRRLANGPVAIETRLGWVLSGPVSTTRQPDESHSLVVHTLHTSTSSAEALDQVMNSFWELESFGIPTTERSLYEQLQDSIKFRDGRYEVRLPWKSPRRELPNNYELSLKRLKGLLRRLNQEPDVRKEYDTVIKTQLNQGIVEPVGDQSPVDIAGVHYLPHHAVIRKDKATTKLRIVYDASARSNGPSLNDCLDPGPKFNQRILDILTRFRVHRVAIIADIEKAFLMISISDEDRNFLRFLWVDDPAKDEPTVIAYRFTRVVFGVTASPFLLNATVRHHLELYTETHGELVQRMLRSIYVDDIVTGSHSEEQAYELYKGAKSLLAHGAFNLRKFSTNSPSLQSRINAEECSPEQDVLRPVVLPESFNQATLGSTEELQSGEHKVLGVSWNISTDQIIFSLGKLGEQARALEPTKRNAISLIGRFYDPLGFLAPIVIKFKVLMQELCKARIAWDAEMPQFLLNQWQKLVSSLSEARPMSIPRCYLDGVQGDVIAYRLFGYCDASMSAYAAVIYLHIDTDYKTHRKFVVAKTRVSPLKQQSIPRLELLSALLLARLMDAVKSSLLSEMNILSYHCYTDSKVALCWIRNVEKAWKPFIQNRVSEIRALLPVDCWRHIPGLDNPADVPSRGTTPLELLLNNLWRNGPDPPVDTEAQVDAEELPSECLVELRATEKAVHGLLTSSGEVYNIENVLHSQDFSKLQRLINVLTSVMKFCSKLRKGAHFAGSERRLAEVLLIKGAQSSLKSHRNYPIWKKQFMLFEDDDGVIRCRGRISLAGNLSYSTKHPILMPSDHPLTILYIRQAHERVLHNGTKETLTELRAKFWVIRGRSSVKKVLHSCVICRKHEGRPFRTPPPPPLPTFRVNKAPPFSKTGVDFAGPLYVNQPDGVQKKVWIVLYTCCVTRAIHLELVCDMSTTTFIRSFKRFSCRRGLPVLIISDNGKTFEAAAKEIKSIISSIEVQHYLEGIGIEWKFNVPRAPWWGGLFERLVRSTKRCLRKILGRSKLDYDELLTALIEIELVLNSRPLTYVSATDLEEPLTPSHLIVGRRLLTLPDHLIEAPGDDSEDEDELTTRFKTLNQTIDGFWERWRTEYLVELREAHRHHKGDGSPQLCVGDVAVVYADDQPRSFWRIGRIERIHVGSDGLPRAATVRVSRNGRVSTLDRPIQHLYPLEVTCRVSPDTLIEKTTAQTPAKSSTDRPRRAAAKKARDRILAGTIMEQGD